MTILNLEGHELLKKQVTTQKTDFDISNFKSGIYFLRVVNKKLVKMGKIIKM